MQTLTWKDRERIGLALSRDGGVYTLLLRMKRGETLALSTVMRLGRGFYAYNGSALGPGGLKARLSHHMRPKERLHWHIDHLLSRPHARLDGILYAGSKERMECRLNKAMKGLLGDDTSIKGFGASDCREGCRGHLLMLPFRTLDRCLGEVSGAYAMLGLGPNRIVIP